MALDKEIKYEVEGELGTISEGSKGWEKKVRLVSWNGAKPKMDIRDWCEQEDGTERMAKGITLTEDEAITLMMLLKEYFDKSKV